MQKCVDGSFFMSKIENTISGPLQVHSGPITILNINSKIRYIKKEVIGNG